mmetsp:Transcript_10969/g.45605  ORF Transcript_10969/g.45605 Transcript_10969/m.45605 type:complete len:112 (-) Transcript_10969:2303-2638(-)
MESSWECSACTFLNEKASVRCEVCHNEAQNGWTCQVCTLVNLTDTSRYDYHAPSMLLSWGSALVFVVSPVSHASSRLRRLDTLPHPSNVPGIANRLMVRPAGALRARHRGN